MTTKEVKERLKKIKYYANYIDDEVAHNEEDELYQGFVKYVAEVGSPELKEIAKLILTSANIHFGRYTS